MKMECLPPTFVTHSSRRSRSQSSRLCHAQMASRNGIIRASRCISFVVVRALIAACLMWSGVGKSGSPGPRVGNATLLAFQLVRCGDDGGRRRDLDSVDTVRELHASPCELQNRVDYVECRKKTSRNFRLMRSSTIGGTSPVNGAPSCAISRTSSNSDNCRSARQHEHRFERSSSFRFISAICSRTHNR